MCTRRKLQLILGLALSVLLVAANTWAEGPFYKRIQQTVEGAKITVKPDRSESSRGRLIARLPGCAGCKPKEFVFDETTILVDSRGVQQPIFKLVSWNGANAWFHYRPETGHIDKITISGQ